MKIIIILCIHLLIVGIRSLKQTLIILSRESTDSRLQLNYDKKYNILGYVSYIIIFIYGFWYNTNYILSLNLILIFINYFLTNLIFSNYFRILFGNTNKYNTLYSNILNNITKVIIKKCSIKNIGIIIFLFKIGLYLLYLGSIYLLIND